MTLPELLGLTIEQQEAMTDAQLLEVFKPFLDVTRPERQTKRTEKLEPVMYISPKKRMVMDAVQELGIDLSFLKRRKK